MGEIGDVGVTGNAGQDGVDASLMLCRIDVDAAPGVGFEAGLAVAGEASCVWTGVLGLRTRTRAYLRSQQQAPQYG